jgi:hypothetical protein
MNPDEKQFSSRRDIAFFETIISFDDISLHPKAPSRRIYRRIT